MGSIDGFHRGGLLRGSIEGSIEGKKARACFAYNCELNYIGLKERESVHVHLSVCICVAGRREGT